MYTEVHLCGRLQPTHSEFVKFVLVVMGKSPGKWIKMILFGKKASKSKSSKGRDMLVRCALLCYSR